MRVYALLVLIAFLSLYAYRDWFKSLCGLILLMAVIEHPDMPTNVGGIQGLNPWNVLMVNIVLPWLVARRREGLAWDMPRHITVLLLLYSLVVIVAFARMMIDRTNLDEYTTGYLVSEHLINSVKWVIPGLLLFDGCRTRRRVLMALACVLAVYFLLAVQVIKYVPATAATSGSDMNRVALKILANDVGYSRVNMSMMLAGAAWAIVATLPLAKSRKARFIIVATALAVSYGQALTGGRMGYVTWGLIGFVFCLLKWRKQLLLIPLFVLGVSFAAPGAVERMLQGFNPRSATGDAQIDDYQVTSGRTMIWPYVIDKIMESPVVGHGKMAMQRTGIAAQLWAELDESFPHPHNAYLECLLDNGVVGLLLVMPFYITILNYSVRMFLDRQHPMCAAVGGVTLALVLALLIASMGSQTFYPREGSVGMWAAIALLLRVVVLGRSAAIHGNITALQESRIAVARHGQDHGRCVAAHRRSWPSLRRRCAPGR